MYVCVCVCVCVCACVCVCVCVDMLAQKNENPIAMLETWHSSSK